MTVTQTIQVVLPIIAYLATTAGAAAVASDLFRRLRANIPQSQIYPAGSLQAQLKPFIYDRGSARLIVLLLAALISVVASVALAAIGGRPLGTALDEALAAALATQLVHAYSILGTPTVPAGDVTFIADFGSKDDAA